jgi:hypothetical protein
MRNSARGASPPASVHEPAEGEHREERYVQADEVEGERGTEGMLAEAARG